MKNSKLFLILSLVMILSILAIAMPAVPAMATGGSISAIPASGAPGTTVTVQGSGYTLGATYSIVRTTTAIEQESGSGLVLAVGVSGSANASGGFTGTFVVPSLPRGTYTLSDANDATVNTTSFDVQPGIYVGSTIGSVGDTITVGGRGFGE